jgi:nicotinate phosphoribosyltransferase
MENPPANPLPETYQKHLDKLDNAPLGPWTDTYFRNTMRIIEQKGDAHVRYAYFMRCPARYCPRLALDFLIDTLGKELVSQHITIEEVFTEGEWVGAGDPMLFISGSFRLLVMFETQILQMLGPACVAADNAYNMCKALPQTSFIAMEARHCVGNDMVSLMNYGASVGSSWAQKDHNAQGFIGNATEATSHFFGNTRGLGTMPHALVGYAGSTVHAAEMFQETFPGQPLTVLVDYFGKEYTDALEVCKRFSNLAQEGKLSLRIDTTRGRYCEGLDRASSYAVLEHTCLDAIRSYRNEKELDHLVGTGVSAASIWKMRLMLNQAGFPKVRIVVSGGFDLFKCQCFALAHVPIDAIGTGSYLPEQWSKTHATADIIAYNNQPRVKIGREYLVKAYETYKKTCNSPSVT